MICNPNHWWVMQIANLQLGYIGLQIRCNGLLHAVETQDFASLHHPA